MNITLGAIALETRGRWSAWRQYGRLGPLEFVLTWDSNSRDQGVGTLREAGSWEGWAGPLYFCVNRFKR